MKKWLTILLALMLATPLLPAHAHAEGCSNCGGDGWITSQCSKCDGAGSASSSCSGCKGTGYRRCNTCSTKGYKKCGACGGDGDTGCNYCRGKGYTGTRRNPRICGQCDGTGYDRCYKCGGGGTLTCSSCSGLGVIPHNECGAKGYKLQSCSKCSGKGNVTYQCTSCSGAAATAAPVAGDASPAATPASAATGTMAAIPNIDLPDSPAVFTDEADSVVGIWYRFGGNDPDRWEPEYFITHERPAIAVMLQDGTFYFQYSDETRGSLGTWNPHDGRYWAQSSRSDGRCGRFSIYLVNGILQLQPKDFEGVGIYYFTQNTDYIIALMAERQPDIEQQLTMLREEARLMLGELP